MKKCITTECNEFLTSSRGLPLMKNLPITGNDVRRVKSRKKRVKNPIDKLLISTFNSQDKILSTSIPVFPQSILPNPEVNQEPFYIFPINGYKALYATEIVDFKAQYEAILRNLIPLSNVKFAINAISQLLLDDYIEVTNLHNVINSKSQIIIYNIPYFYALRTSAIKSYAELASYINS